SALVIFILWDYVAFYFFWHYKNWARKYILSIGVFYLIGCFFDFNFLQFFYGLITVYYLFGKQARKEFFPYPRRRPFDL
ncbi:MAG: hypothetical protein KDD50_13245, partial [Bdellovibrionales bacterium]|nr:hypothetical protein [Bdellovibrionales bacterium]